MARIDEPITIKGYANRRLYHTGSGTDVTLTDLAGMVEDDEDFVVLDAAIGADITHSVLHYIMIERAGHG